MISTATARPSDLMLERLVLLAAREGIAPPDPADPRRMLILAQELGHRLCGTEVYLQGPRPTRKAKAAAEQLADGFAVALLAQLAAEEIERLERDEGGAA